MASLIRIVNKQRKSSKASIQKPDEGAGLSTFYAEETCASRTLNNNSGVQGKVAERDLQHSAREDATDAMQDCKDASQPLLTTSQQCPEDTSPPQTTDVTRQSSAESSPQSSSSSQLSAKDTFQLQDLGDSVSPQNTGIYTTEDRFAFRLHKVIQTVAVYVLHLVLSWGTQDRPLEMNFLDYFTSVKKMSKMKLKGFFMKTQMDSLQQCSTDDSFDVTLLFACILCAYKETDDVMEHIRYIKNFRNELAHSKMDIDNSAFLEIIDQLRDRFVSALKSAGGLNSIPEDVVEKHVNEMNENLNKVIGEQIVQWDITSYENELLFEQKLQNLLTVGPENLKALYERWVYLTPLSFLSGNTHLHVGMVFTDLELMESGQGKNSPLVEYQDIFLIDTYSRQTYSNERGASRVILVEGPAGSGKTTLTKVIIDNWIQGRDVIRGLTKFQLLLHTECRNPSIRSFTQLLTVLMPDVAKRFRAEDMVSCVLACKILMIVDGVDEMTSSSRALFEEILSLINTADITVVITTRPEAVDDYYKMIPLGTDTVHIKIKGIPEGKREEFALKYHSEMERTGQGSRDTSGLVKYLRKTGVHLKEHWRLPLHLAMAVILWVVSPDAINGVTTATELFMETENLRDEKLCERVKKNEHCKCLAVKEIKEKIEIFRLSLYKIALYGQREGDVILTNDSLEILEKICKFLNLPDSEVMGAFFVRKITWSGTAMQTQYSFAHKGTQDFYSAMHIVNVLHGKECPESLEHMQGCIETSWQKILTLKKKTILNILKDPYRSNPEDFNLKKFQNVLVHLTGLIDIGGEIARKEVLSEIVKLLRKSGIDDEQAWLDILSDIKLNDAINKEVSKYIPDIMNLNGHIEITDARVATFAKMILHAKPTRVTICLESDPEQVPYLQELLEALYYMKCETELYFYHDFLHPSSDSLSVDSPLPQLFKVSRVTKFMGHVDQTLLRKLPDDLRAVCAVALDDRHYQTLLSRITSLPNLEWVWLHVRADLPAKLYQPLAGTNHVIYRSSENRLLVKQLTGSPLEVARLEKLLDLVDSQHGHEARAAFRCDVEMLLVWDLQQPGAYDRGTDRSFQRLFARSKVTLFKGCLGSRSMASLPNTLRRLSILIVDDNHYKAVEPSLTSVLKTHPNLRRIRIHVGPDVSPSVLRPFPSTEVWITLIFNKLQDASVSWVCKIVKAFQTDNWFSCLQFPQMSMSVEGYTLLLQTLAELGVMDFHGGGILVPHSWASSELRPQLESLTRKYLQCSLFVVNESEIW
ncbi:uncharacterized protein LOC122263312 [Penaeus japonicus]|uniref:uncharacterized protein LOC122263312 n=1 Tax=Penaeus japonicus TaxID=27405 RepID=UPI001C71786B|nr:uncharacterized protein LOC122263312 [Penaeus japonicus]XP_042887629.1 uncharacterized protein LOC122263312 [Penaeus japonicus]XP_042887630.1 uncharacterized protein LOC122263312 [Penaeus japonicus]XP_042887631.1 uncharacterized protein LOC122263312 [Penaeus japonicus]